MIKVSIGLSPDDFAALKALAASRGQKNSAAIRQLIRDAGAKPEASSGLVAMQFAQDWSAVVLACSQVDGDARGLVAESLGELARCLRAAGGVHSLRDVVGDHGWNDFAEACAAAGLSPDLMGAAALRMLAQRASRKHGPG